MTRGFNSALKKVEIEICGAEYIVNPVPETIYPLTIQYGVNDGKYIMVMKDLLWFYKCTSYYCTCSITDVQLYYQTDALQNTYQVLISSSIMFDKKEERIVIDSMKP